MDPYFPAFFPEILPCDIFESILYDFGLLFLFPWGHAFVSHPSVFIVSELGTSNEFVNLLFTLLLQIQ